MNELRQLKRKTIISTISLFLQSGYSAILGLTANLVITILLSPTIYGIYLTMLSIISLLNYFSDIGLAASLIQKEDIDQKDLSTTFTVQQILIISVVIIGFIATPFIMSFYKLPPDGTYLYWALLLGFFFSSLKTIPSILLERAVKFQKIVLVQIVENTVFYTTVVICAVMGLGLRSFAIAVMVRSISGLIIMYSISFWMPQIGISLPHLKHLLRFGLPFQTSSFLALFKDDLLTLYLGKVIGFEGLGYIGWAKKWAEAPLRIIMDNVSRVLFPVMSRLQSDSNQLKKLIERILTYQTLLIAPAITSIALLMHYMVILFPKYEKWTPALPLLYIFSLSAILSSYSSPFTNLFNSLGKAKITLFFMIFWTAGIWILTAVLNNIIGYAGFPVAQLILSFSFVVVVQKARTIVSFSFVKPIYKPLLATIGIGITFALMSILIHNPLIALISSVVSAPIIYFGILYLFRFNFISQIKALLVS